LDLKNCVNIKKDLLWIRYEGRKNVIPGLVYKYTISIERPANGLTISPIIIGTQGITFTPNSVTFADYSKANLTIDVSVKTSVSQGTYLI